MPATCVMEPKYTSPIVRNRLHIAYLPSVIVAAGITWLSLIRDVPAIMQVDIPLADKWGHMLAYLVFALCLAGDSYRARVSTRVIYMVSIVLPVVYGGLIEVIQPYFPPRAGEWTDWLADCIGVAIGIAIFGIYHVYAIRRKKASS